MIYEERFDVYVNLSGLFKRKKAFVSLKHSDDYEEAIDGFNRINGTTLDDWKVTDNGLSLTLKTGTLFNRIMITVIPGSETLNAVAVIA
jgi:hypothetical protein